MAEVRLRDATPEDVPLILAFTAQLAEFESGTMTAIADDMHARFFGPTAIATGVIAELDGKPVGSALYYFAFSSYTARPILCLEDIFVNEECRGHGVGKKLMAELSTRAVAAGCLRMQWSALDWNENAIAIYEGLGAVQSEGTVYFKFGEDAMKKLAGERGE